MSVNTNTANYWGEIKGRKQNAPLTFIHTPKCGGTYAISILTHLGIKNKGHNLATKTDGITFTIIRDPVERFESLMNYRLDEEAPRRDWPKSLRHVYNNNDSTNLNIIVKNMTDKDILEFYPYKTLSYWSKNIDIFITIDKLHDFLTFFGYEYDENDFSKKNVSTKTRGTLNSQLKQRLSKIYSNVVALFKNITMTQPPHTPFKNKIENINTV